MNASKEIWAGRPTDELVGELEKVETSLVELAEAIRRDECYGEEKRCERLRDMLRTVRITVSRKAYVEQCYRDGEIPCVSMDHHRWVVSDEDDNVVYCKRCGCAEY